MTEVSRAKSFSTRVEPSLAHSQSMEAMMPTFPTHSERMTGGSSISDMRSAVIDQRRRLYTLYTFFNPSELPSFTVPEVSLSPPAGSRKRKGTFVDDDVARQGWGEGALRRVKLPLSLPDFTAASLEHNPTCDAATFLSKRTVSCLIAWVWMFRLPSGMGS